MRAISGMSILNNDCICSLDRNMRILSHNVSRFRVREGQVPILKVSLAPLTYDEEKKSVIIVSKYLGSCGLATFRKSCCDHRSDWNFDTD